MLLGGSIIITDSAGYIHASKSDSISVDCETIEIASTNARWRTFIAGRSSWSFTCNFLVSSLGAIVPPVGATVKITIKSNIDGDQLEGYAICTSSKTTATKGNLSQGSFSFQGTGALE